jgi:hypothetical protein
MEKKHSGLGITSLVISVLAGVALFVLLVIAGVMETTTPGGIDEESAQAVVIGLFLFLTMFIQLIAVGFGIAGIVQQQRLKLFGILGLVFSLLALLFSAGMLLLGLVS